MPKKNRGFQAFMFDTQLFVGPCADVEVTPRRVGFIYTYAWNTVPITGSFVGKRDDGQVVGTWQENSEIPIDGRRSWKGSATFHIIEADGCTNLAGVWKMGRTIVDRWMVDLP
jgi:hypothetical protein